MGKTGSIGSLGFGVDIIRDGEVAGSPGSSHRGSKDFSGGTDMNRALLIGLPFFPLASVGVVVHISLFLSVHVRAKPIMPPLKTTNLHVFQNEVTMAIKGFHASQKLAVIAHADQDLGVASNGALEDGERSSRELVLLQLRNLIFAALCQRFAPA